MWPNKGLFTAELGMGIAGVKLIVATDENYECRLIKPRVVSVK